MLRLLQNSFRAQRFDNRGYFLSLVANDDDRFPRLQRRARANNVLHQRAPTSPMQSFSEAGLQPRALSRGKNDDGKVWIRHGS